MREPVAVPSEQVQCSLHQNHGSSRPLRTVWHHVWPMGWGGPDVRPGQVGGAWICDNGHYSVHRILDWLRKEDKRATILLSDLLTKRPPFGGGRKEIDLARRGFKMWVDAGRPVGGGSGGN